MVIEDMRDVSMDLMCKLFKVLDSSVIVTPDQMTRVSIVKFYSFSILTNFKTLQLSIYFFIF